MEIFVKRLESGYYHVRGQGPCNWAQPPHWPCNEEQLREHSFPAASEGFVRSALDVLNILPEDVEPDRRLVTSVQCYEYEEPNIVLIDRDLTQEEIQAIVRAISSVDPKETGLYYVAKDGFGPHTWMKRPATTPPDLDTDIDEK